MKRSGKGKIIITLILAQTCLVLFIIGADIWDEGFPAIAAFFSPILFLTGLLGVSSFFIVLEVLRLIEKDAQAEVTKLQLEELKNENLILREQRHDVKNHFQVVLGFIQLKKYDLAEDYIKRILNEKNINIRKIEGINAPENIKVLLSNKMALAAEKTIEFNIDIRSRIEDYKIDTFDLTRILSNLLTNAFYAAEKAKDFKRVSLSIWEDRKLNIEVANTGVPIPENIKDKIFEPGLTTKGEKGDGMGLYIVRKLTRKYGGKVNLIKSDEQETVFGIKFPLE
ncbi:MAG: histidine kinase [Clostridiales bacterium]|jgi:hypothetical protein|nr:histidine kinase [Clostridiales bacterium]